MYKEAENKTFLSRLFFEKDHAQTQTEPDNRRKKFRSKGSCTKDDNHFTKSIEVQE